MGILSKALHVGISVYNMEESIAWYEKNLDFEICKNDGYVPPLGAKIVFMKNKDIDFEIELFEYDEPKPIPEDRKTPNTDLQTVGTKHLAVQTPDMEAVKARFLENGVDIAHEVTMDGESVMFVRDCNGVLVEIIQPAQ